MEDLVTFKIVRKLKEKEFDGKYLFINTPTISQVLKWLREKKKIHIEMLLYDGTYSYLIKSIDKIDKDVFHKCLNEDTTDEEYDTYEEAALAGIEYVLNNLI